MKVMIEYESSWRNSFLSGNNNEALPKNGRDFIGSMTSLKKPENFIKRDVTIDTVMGVLNRIIGDQRKLYQSRGSDSYYFKNIENNIKFVDTKSETNEMTYIRNIKGSTDQNSFTGMVKTNDKIFQSDYSQELWGVLSLNIDELFSYIANDNKVETLIDLDPISICAKFDEIKKAKPIEAQGMAKKAIKYLDIQFPGTNYLNKNEKIVPENVYCSALYLQIERLAKNFNMSEAVNRRGNLSGISKRIFTKKDFMNHFTTGEKKKIWGNPYIRKERIKGEGEVVSMMTKASGTLEININVDRDKAEEIKNLIANAGVSSFYLGKKGLAYVTDIDTRVNQ